MSNPYQAERPERRSEPFSPARSLPQLSQLDYKSAGKRACDVTIAGAALVLAAPVILILLAIVAMNGGRPVFSQARVGRGGELFRCYKIRSMVIGAEDALNALLARDPAAAAEWAESQKLTDDPRVTRFGRFLRQTSLDELPQLWNVIRGDMSIVGPRPVLPDELARYGAETEAYVSVRPGLTGPWQVSGRNSISYDERVALDADYVQNLSLLRDVAIIFGTARSVVMRTGQ